MDGFHERRGFILHLYTDSQMTSTYMYDLGRITSAARGDYTLNPEDMAQALKTIEDWWKEVIKYNSIKFTKIIERPLSYEIQVLETGDDTGKLKIEIQIEGYHSEAMWDPESDTVTIPARDAFDMSPDQFQWYIGLYSEFLSTIEALK
jgi:hypothetical protein